MGTTNNILPEYVAYSTKDMVNSTYHGSIMKATDVSWRNDDFSCWAAQMIEYRGKFYLYFCMWDRTDNGKQSIGVAGADSPTGPYVDIGHPLVKGSVTMPQTSDWNDIDPTVFVDVVDGVERRYLAWGNGIYYIAELNEDMISIKDQNGDGLIRMNDDIFQQTFREMNGSFTEGPWLYRRGDIYYNFFARNWREDLAYVMASSPMGPWYFASMLMEPTATSNTNHPAVVDFNGKTYLFYHNGMLPGGSGYSRTICVQEIRFDANGFIYPMVESSVGLTGSASSIKTISGAVMGVDRFRHSYNDADYPYVRTVRFGASLDFEWEIIQGRGNAGDEFVSIQAVRHPGLLITATTGGRVVLTQDVGANRMEAMTFRTVKGLSGDGVSFESMLYPGSYLTNSGGTLVLSDGADAAESTFVVEGIEFYQYLAIPNNLNEAFLRKFQ
jgi:hypothetical protein